MVYPSPAPVVLPPKAKIDEVAELRDIKAMYISECAEMSELEAHNNKYDRLQHFKEDHPGYLLSIPDGVASRMYSLAILSSGTEKVWSMVVLQCEQQLKGIYPDNAMSRPEFQRKIQLLKPEFLSFCADIQAEPIRGERTVLYYALISKVLQILQLYLILTLNAKRKESANKMLWDSDEDAAGVTACCELLHQRLQDLELTLG